MALLPIILAVWTGCASTQDTPQQEYVWAMGRICDAKSNTWSMDKVEADGRYTIRGAANSVPSPDLPYFDCMRAQFKAQPGLPLASAREQGRSYSYWIKFPVRTYQQFENRAAIPAY
jgi:hypothetical protein